MAVIVKKGTEVICPNCGAILMKFTRDIRNKEVVTLKDLEKVTQEPNEADRGMCRQCNQAAFLGKRGLGFVQIHTSKGWLPEGPKKKK